MNDNVKDRLSSNLIPFVSLDEKHYKIIRAVTSSLTIKEVAEKSGLAIYDVSRLLSKERGRRGIQLYFDVDMRSFGLLPIATISARDIRSVPFLRSKRTLHVMGRQFYLYVGIVPEDDENVNGWLSLFEEGAIHVRALEELWWIPDRAASIYLHGVLYGDPTLAAVKDVPLREVNQRLELDPADALIIGFKMQWPFTSLREVSRGAKKYLGKRVTHQTLSRHYTGHVLKAWRGNRVRLYRDLSDTPYRIVYLEGRDAASLANAMTQLPWFHTAYVDAMASLVSGQPPCSSMLPMYKAIKDVDVTCQEFVMEPSFVKYIPLEELLMKFAKAEVAVNQP